MSFSNKFLLATHPSPPPNSTKTKLYSSVGGKHLQSAFQGQGGFLVPHAMKTLLDPERHNTEGVFRNQGGLSAPLQAKNPSQHQVPERPSGLQCLSCVRRSRQGADGCALGAVGEQANSSRIWSKETVGRFSVPADR